MEARIEELTQMMNHANLQPPRPPPSPQRGPDESNPNMQVDSAQDVELQRKDKERFDRAIHQAYKATPAFCPDEEDYVDWVEMTWLKWSTCGLNMDLYEYDRSKDADLKKLLYNCLTIKPQGEKSSPNHTFLIGMNPVLDLPGDSFPQYYQKLMVQFASPDRQIQAAAEFDIRKQERTEEPAVYAAEKLKLWYRSNCGAGANNTRAFLHAAINGLLNREVRKRLFELGQSITLSSWVTTVQSVSMTVWTLFFENVGPEGVSGSGLSVGRRNVLSLKKQAVMAVNEAMPEEYDPLDMDNAEGLTGIGEAMVENGDVYAVNPNNRNRGRCFDCGSLDHFQNSPKCNEKGARKYAPPSSANNKFKKIAYHPQGDSKSTNQVINRKKNSFPPNKTKGRSAPPRGSYANKRRVRYVQVVEEGETSDDEDISAAESEGEGGGETVANISESPTCYGWTAADEYVLEHSIFGVMTPIPATHTTTYEENKENDMEERAPRDPIRDPNLHRTGPASNSAFLPVSLNLLSDRNTSQILKESSKNMPEKEKSSGNPVNRVTLTPREPGAVPKLREIRPMPPPHSPLPPTPPAAAEFSYTITRTAPPPLIPLMRAGSPVLMDPMKLDTAAADPLALATADEPLAVEATAVDPTLPTAEDKSMKGRTASVARLRAWQTSLEGRGPAFYPGMPPPGPGMPLPLGRDPFMTRKKVNLPAPVDAFYSSSDTEAGPTRLQMYHRRARRGPLTRAEMAARPTGPPAMVRAPQLSKAGRGRGRGRGVKPSRSGPPAGPPGGACSHCLPCGSCVACKVVPPPPIDGGRPLPLQPLPAVEAVLLRTKAALRCAFYKYVHQGPIHNRHPFDNGTDLDRCIIRLLLAQITMMEEKNGNTAAARPVAVVEPVPRGAADATELPADHAAPEGAQMEGVEASPPPAAQGSDDGWGPM